jgi:hypothetical protein
MEESYQQPRTGLLKKSRRWCDNCQRHDKPFLMMKRSRDENSSLVVIIHRIRGDRWRTKLRADRHVKK